MSIQKIISAGLIVMSVFGGVNAKSRYKEYTISDSYSHKNLDIFLIHGKNILVEARYITLGEAMKKKIVKVYETENVNQLSIENLSTKDTIYIQSGDIVKGGKQDRVLQYDLILQPRSGKQPISSFCVEQGRWNKRGNENLHTFQSSDMQLASKKLKLATKEKADQSEVWKHVAGLQEAASANVGGSVQSRESASSLQLTLENKKIKQKTKEYIDNLKGILKNKKDVLGYVFVINNEINSGDIYGHKDLFVKLWPKMLEATVVEAVSEANNKSKNKKIISKDIKRWFEDVEKGKKSKKNINKQTYMRINSSSENIEFETYDKDKGGKVIHKNVM